MITEQDIMQALKGTVYFGLTAKDILSKILGRNVGLGQASPETIRLYGQVRRLLAKLMVAKKVVKEGANYLTRDRSEVEAQIAADKKREADGARAREILAQAGVTHDRSCEFGVSLTTEDFLKIVDSLTTHAAPPLTERDRAAMIFGS